MPIEAGTVEVLKALGQTAGTAVGAAAPGVVGATTVGPSPLTLTITTRVIDLVSKHLDRIIDRFNPPQEPKQKVTGKQILEKAKDAEAKGGKGKPNSPGDKQTEEKKSPFSGIEAIEAFEVFIGLQDQNITLGQFGLWLDENKVKLAGTIDKIVQKVG